MKDETVGQGHADGAEGTGYRVRLKARSPLTAMLAVVVMGMTIFAAGASRYLAGQSSGSHAPMAESTPVETSTRTSQTPPPSAAVMPTSNLPLIAWTGATPTPLVPTPVTSPTPPSIRRCAVGHLTLVAVAQAWGRSVENEIQMVVTNAGPAACYVEGVPQVAVEQAGQQLSLTLQPAPAEVPTGPVALGPGSQAIVEAGLDSYCAPDFAKPTTVAIQVSSGLLRGRVKVSDDTIACEPGSAGTNTMTVYPFEPYPPQPAPEPTWAQVEVGAIELPAYAVAGRPMTYAIILTNTGETAASLDPCPSYSQSILGMPDHEADGAIIYLLNCAAIGPVIAPHQSVHLAMVYQVPAATPAGAQTFFWESYSGSFQAATKVWLEVRPG
ncbi:MAG: DUF4232 domain-containing protein [Candidatus Limnocylindrales bacterium]|jgi:hypothetical protein